MLANFVNATYLAAGLMFILALAGLSKHETAKKGNAFGILGMIFAVVATNYAITQPGDGRGLDWASAVLLYAAITTGAIIGAWKAHRTEMSGLPHLIALFHSFVGGAAVLVSINVHLTAGPADVLHAVEVVTGMIIGAVTFVGSLIAWGKLNGRVASKPLALPGRPWLNLALLVTIAGLSWWYVAIPSLIPLLLVVLASLMLGCHLAAAASDASMPVAISALGSCSGWAAAVGGVMLNQTILVMAGALAGVSGTVLSCIMSRARNRSLGSVSHGGPGDIPAVDDGPGDPRQTTTSEVAKLLGEARSVVIAPGHGMATAGVHHHVAELATRLRERGVNVRFAIHPAAGRLPGHMDVLLAEAGVPSDIVLGMGELTDDFTDPDVVLVIGANDTVSPATDDPGSPICGMPGLTVWDADRVVVFTRSMNTTGYAGARNPLSHHENPVMCLGDAKAAVHAVLRNL